MNKHKITSILLTSTMLFESFPVVNASDDIVSNNISLSSKNNDTQYTENIKEDLNIDIFDNSNTIDANNNKNIESVKNTEDFTLDDVESEDLNSDTNNNNNDNANDSDKDNDNLVIPSSEGKGVDNNFIIENLESNTTINTNQDTKLNIDIISENIEESDVNNIDDSVVNVLEITLADGEYVPDLTNNPDGYETIIVKTIGNKKLVSTDYDRLRTSKIPNIDLSQSTSDSIPEGAFSNATHLTSFQFPQGIKSIDSASIRSNGAFYNCSNLKGNLIIPDSVISIGAYAFYLCQGFDGNLVIPNSVVTIGNYAFSACSGFTGDLVIPNSVTSISKEAFSFCRGFTGDLVIPNSVTSIEAYAFYGCSGFTGNLVIPNSVVTIGNYVFTNCSGFTGDLVIPDSVTTIGISAFHNCSGLTGNLVIPNSVATINDNAFYGCKGFTGSVIIPDSVTSLSNTAFKNCSNIQNFIFKTNESFADSNYRKNIFDSLDTEKTIVEIPYSFDVSGTCLDCLDINNNGKPAVKSEIITANGDKSLSISLYIPTPYKEENIVLLRDGEKYKLPEKTSEGKYIFNEEGYYSITLITDLGSTSKIDFEVAASINKPTISYENNLVSIVDNGNNLGTIADRIEYRLNNREWRLYEGSFRIPDELVNGMDDIKVEARVIVNDKLSKITEYSLTIPKAQLNVEDVEITKGDEFNELDYVTATDIDGTDISARVTIAYSNVKVDVPGEYTVIYRIEASNGYFTEKEIKVTILNEKLPPILIANDVSIKIGEEFDPFDFIIATDSDGNIIDKSEIEIIENTVNPLKSGTYKITYRIIGDNGLTTIMTISVTIENSETNNENNNSENNDNNTNTDDNINNTHNKKDDYKETNKLPSTGGFAPILYLSVATSLLSGYITLKKEKNPNI